MTDTLAGVREMMPPAAQAGPSNHGGYRRLTTFSSADPVEWDAWKSTFLQTTICNQWSDARARRELLASMSGEAFTQVRNIDVEADPDENGKVQPVAELLAKYEERFMPESAVGLARQRFFAARQRQDETNNTFHNRVRSLWTAAHPGVDTASINQDRNAREIFVYGLRNRNVRELTAHAIPNNFEEALARANAQEAVQRTLIHRDPFHRGTNQLNAMGTGPGAPSGPRCYGCNQAGHLRRECPHEAKREERPLHGTARATTAHAARGRVGVRGRRTPRGGGRGSRRVLGQPRLNALDAGDLGDGADEEEERIIGEEEGDSYPLEMSPPQGGSGN